MKDLILTTMFMIMLGLVLAGMIASELKQREHKVQTKVIIKEPTLFITPPTPEHQ